MLHVAKGLTMKKIVAAAFTLLAIVSISLPFVSAADDDGWVSLFNGKDLSGWTISENGQFTVEDGCIVVRGKRAHLFTKKTFKDFHFKTEIKTEPGANSGLYFHTKHEETWPTRGYEVQVNCSHSDPVKNGSLWGVVRNFDPIAKDNEWYTMEIIVKGKDVITKVNGKTVVHYTELEGVTAGRRIDQGSMAIQAHDPKSIIRYRNVQIKPL